MPSSSSFAGRLAVVTGGASGIGAGITRALAEHGARVLIVDTDLTSASALAAELGRAGCPEPVVLELDVLADAAADIVRARAVELAPSGADLLVNNVGDFRPAGDFRDSDPEAWQAMYAVNLLHVLRMTHALLPDMVSRGRGAILNVSSVEGMRGIPGNAVYGAMKAAVISFTASLAVEVGRFGVRVNCLAPDLTDTAQTPLGAAVQEKYGDHIGKWVPAGRFGQPSDHGAAAVFLLSDEAGFITGETLRVDGGTLAAPGWFRRNDAQYTNMPRPLK